jgi:hypothetical protein
MMSGDLPTFRIEAGECLQHVSRICYRGCPLVYGRSKSNRYDDPLGRYGVLYLGPDLPTALMETVFHRHQWLTQPDRAISLQEVQSRLVRVVGVLADVSLADLTAPGVMAGYFGLNLEQLACRDYTVTQQLSGQIHAMQTPEGLPRFDGVLYPSRNNYPASSMALFERSRQRVEVVDDIDLVDHLHWPDFVARYRIGVVPTF